MKITVLYVGSSLLAPLSSAEREINARYQLGLRVVAHNFGRTFTDDEWQIIEQDISQSNVVFVIHVMDGENAVRLMGLLDRLDRQNAVVVINCMPALMKRTRIGKLDLARFAKVSRNKDAEADEETAGEGSLVRSIAGWIGRQVRNGKNGHGRSDYLKWADRLPKLLRLAPNTGLMGDAKKYLMLVSYFLQPTPANIQSMLLLGLQASVADERLASIDVPPPEARPSMGIYHPDAPAVFETFEAYQEWYRMRARCGSDGLDQRTTIGLLLMRRQIVSNSRKDYDGLIRAVEAEGLDVIPVISTLMDNREACERFLVAEGKTKSQATDKRCRASQIVSLTGFSFVGGPAMNDSEAAAQYLHDLNVPYRSLVSLDIQSIESWQESFTGLNPVQTGMQVAIPEIDGATEPFVFGGIPARGVEPAPLEDRCARVAKRIKRWNRLQTADRKELRIALVLYCFPPNKGNIGTAADLDVFASLFDMLSGLQREGYLVELPESADALRRRLLDGNSQLFNATANISYRMNVDEYR